MTVTPHPFDIVDDHHDRPLRGNYVDLRKIRAIREETGLSIEHAAAFAGLGRNTLQRLEAGKTDPRISTLRRLLDLYGERLGRFLSIGDYLEA